MKRFYIFLLLLAGSFSLMRGASPGVSPQENFKKGLAAFEARDHSEAFPLFLEAAEAGYAPAQFYTGYYYQYGLLAVTPDEALAYKYYKLAADGGIAEANQYLGHCYLDGRGVAQDEAEAARYFRIAAEAGVVESQFLLGNCYARGTGVKKDIDKATFWLRKAADAGYQQAADLLEILPSWSF